MKYDLHVQRMFIGILKKWNTYSYENLKLIFVIIVCYSLSSTLTAKVHVWARHPDSYHLWYVFYFTLLIRRTYSAITVYIAIIKLYRSLICSISPPWFPCTVVSMNPLVVLFHNLYFKALNLIRAFPCCVFYHLKSWYCLIITTNLFLLPSRYWCLWSLWSPT